MIMNIQSKPWDLDKDLLMDVRDVRDLRVSFRTDEGLITPVDGVTFQVRREKTPGIVGESGSGKTTIGRAILRALKPTSVPAVDRTLPFDPIRLEGEIPNPVDPPHGCRFHTRCPYADDQCRHQSPQWREIEPLHMAACHHGKTLELNQAA